MESNIIKTPPLKSALFVDFDNIYIGLSKSDPLAAERFASDPARWLSWLERGMPIRQPDENASPRQRSILVRRCYPNPDAGFRRFRSFFTSAAFTVIDCPSLTRMGKNSSDIYMVMDILDILNHKTYFDELIIFSGDSDFMPVLLRLRAHDRRTTTLAIDFMPPAYKAACDLVISEEEFIEEALGVAQDTSGNGTSVGRSSVSRKLLDEMAARLYEAVSDESEVAGADLPDILKDFREFRDSSNWLGFGTSQRLAEALSSCEPRLHTVRLNPNIYKVVLKTRQENVDVVQSANKTALPEETITVPAISRRKPKTGKTPEQPPSESPGLVKIDHENVDFNQIQIQVIEVVKEMLAESPVPILLARASQMVVHKIGPKVLDTQWAGAGSFKRLLQRDEELGFEITTQPEPGYIFDPRRHTHPMEIQHQILNHDQTDGIPQIRVGSNKKKVAPHEPDKEIIQPYLDSRLPEPYEDVNLPDEEDYHAALPSIEELIQRVSRVTGAPDLTPQQYALAFRGIVIELQKIALGDKAYNTYQASKSVSEWCSQQGNQVSRNDLVWIFKGIIFHDGIRFAKYPGGYTVGDLASVVISNIKGLCRRSRLELTEYESGLVDEWITSGLDEGDPL